jgi:hypothetical protein
MTYSGAKAILSRGPSRPTLYQVTLPEVGGKVNDYLKFFCSATSIPEIRAERTTAISHGAIGIEQQMVSRLQFGKPFEITVIENADFLVYKGIRKWFDQLTSNSNRGSGGGGGANAGQRPEYYSSIVRDFTLTKLENPGQVDPRGGGSVTTSLEVNFKNAYPVRMGNIQLGSDMFDSATTFTVGFFYETYSVR